MFRLLFAIVITSAAIALPATAEEDVLNSLTKEQLVEVIREQQKLIDSLKRKVERLERNQASPDREDDQVDIAEDDKPKDNDKPKKDKEEYRTVSQIFRDFPSELLPDEEKRWSEEDQSAANKWLEENVNGSVLKTYPKASHGFVSDSFMRNGNKSTSALFPAFKGRVVRAQNGSAYIRQQTHISIRRRAKLAFRFINYTFSDKDLAWEFNQLERGSVVTVEGVIKSVTLSSRHPVNVTIDLEPDPKITLIKRAELRDYKRESIELP